MQVRILLSLLLATRNSSSELKEKENKIMFLNVVIGKPLVEPWHLISTCKEEFEQFDKRDTLFTEERFLPAILVDAGVVSSRSEVRRNKPELCKTLDKLDCLWVKWGRKKIWIVVGE